MVSTLKLDELTKSTKTIYEAVMCVAKRARQINNENRAKLELVLGPDDQIEDEFEEIQVEVHNQVYDRKAKPTHQAIEELIEGEVTIVRPDEISEDPEEAEEDTE
jgi:DNA-directed RNA polymerase subunit K/omega